MNLIQIFLPYTEANGRKDISQVRDHLAEKFGGATAFTQAPAEGLWKKDESHVEKDAVVIVEVMTENFDEAWWKAYQQKLEQVFQQEEILIRLFSVTKL